MAEYISPVQQFDDGSSIQTFDDGSTLVTDSAGAISSTPSTDSVSATAGGGESLLSGVGSAISGAASSVTGAVGGALSGALGGLTGSLSGILGSTLGNLLGSALKVPTPTSIIPNPLHQFASHSYAWSLWWLDIDDYNRMSSGGDIGTGIDFQLGPSSYVVAEDSGLYPQRRLPTQLGLNYNIQDVNFETVVGLNSKSKSSNMTTGNMTVVEPYGVTFLDSLVRASGMSGTYKNYTSQPYMLQLDFTGYYDDGSPAPASATSYLRKRFPIQILSMTIDVTGKGAEYKIEFVPMGHIAHTPEHATVPKDLVVNASTVGGFFTAFENALNAFWQLEVTDQKSQYADTIKFKIDPAIAGCGIVYNKQMSIKQANPNSKGIDLSQGNFSIPAGTQIQEVINRVIQQSDFLVGQLGLDQQNDNPSNVETSTTQVLNSFKTTVQVSYTGSGSSGAFDNIRNTYAKQFNYSVLQYSVYDAKHPAAPTLTDPRPYVVKKYDYLYTGQNVDIVDLKINFDSTFYTAVNTYTNQYGASQTTASTAIDSLLGAGTSLLLSPQLLGALNIIPGLGGIANLTPNRFKNIVNDQRDNTGFNTINNPGSQTAANVQKSLYTNQKQEMLSVDLTILGDPTLLKQDDWLYTIDPTMSGGIFGQLLSQFSIAQQHGHISMDGGELICSLTINTPVDVDTEWTNKGLMYPAIGSTPSLFTGYYRIISIKNNFAGGKFTQVLSLIKNSNSDIISASAPGAPAGNRGITGALQGGLNSLNSTISGSLNGVVGGAVGLVSGAVTSAVGGLEQSISGMAKSVLGSSATAAGDSVSDTTAQATVDSAGAVTSEYDATRWGEG